MGEHDANGAQTPKLDACLTPRLEATSPGAGVGAGGGGLSGGGRSFTIPTVKAVRDVINMPVTS